MVLRQIALAERAVRGTTEPARGVLVLGLPPSLARTVVVPLIDAFREQLPEVTLRTVDGLSAKLVELVETGNLDCSVVYSQPHSDLAELRLLADEDLYLVAGLTTRRAGKPLPHSLTLADVATLPLVISGKLNAVHVALKTADVQHSDAAARIARDREPYRDPRLGHKGYGSSVIPLGGVHSCIGDPQLRLHRIRKPVLRCSLSLVSPTRALDDALIKQGTSLVREVVREQLAQFRTDVENAIDA